MGDREQIKQVRERLLIVRVGAIWFFVIAGTFALVFRHEISNFLAR